jgi:hypothetical protein
MLRDGVVICPGFSELLGSYFCGNDAAASRDAVVEDKPGSCGGDESKKE